MHISRFAFSLLCFTSCENLVLERQIFYILLWWSQVPCQLHATCFTDTLGLIWFRATIALITVRQSGSFLLTLKWFKSSRLRHIRWSHVALRVISTTCCYLLAEVKFSAVEQFPLQPFSCWRPLMFMAEPPLLFSLLVTWVTVVTSLWSVSEETCISNTIKGRNLKGQDKCSVYTDFFPPSKSVLLLNA